MQPKLICQGQERDSAPNVLVSPRLLRQLYPLTVASSLHPYSPVKTGRDPPERGHHSELGYYGMLFSSFSPSFSFPMNDLRQALVSQKTSWC
ncbi:unnamed protein product [Pieris brassicae]|uniref:Uncharacterized protein n=1 Tax=Pieris brassicae TaxID=7116 RepID=A0A9P0TTG0_PIEBR|nr:unnamed protein product [Pieris brassicae]